MCDMMNEASRTPSTKKYLLSWKQYSSLAARIAAQAAVHVQVSPKLLALLSDARFEDERGASGSKP